MSAAEWIELRRAHEQSATPKPWKTWAMSVLSDPVGDSNLDTAIPVADTHYRNADGQPRTNDADYIADARTSLPRALDALEAVMAKAGEVEATHHFHGDTCLCGFNSSRARSRTEHLTGMLTAAIEAALKADA